MSQAFTHPWDEIEYFQLAVPQAEKDPKVAEVKPAAIAATPPSAFFIGDVPPPRPAAGSRANESVFCDICHTITGKRGRPGQLQLRPLPGRTARPSGGRRFALSRDAVFGFRSFAGILRNLPQRAESLRPLCQVHSARMAGRTLQPTGRPLPGLPYVARFGTSADMGSPVEDMARHTLGAHVPSKVRGRSMKIYADADELEPGEKAVISISTTPRPATRSRPARWRTASSGSRSTPSTPPGSATPCRWTKRIPGRGVHDHLQRPGLPRYGRHDDGSARISGRLPGRGAEEGHRVFRRLYFDPKGRMTIGQWNTASFGTDYRIGPRETKIETYSWTLPQTLPEGPLRIEAKLYYRLLVKSVADFLKVPPEESAALEVNSAETVLQVVF